MRKGSGSPEPTGPFGERNRPSAALGLVLLAFLGACTLVGAPPRGEPAPGVTDRREARDPTPPDGEEVRALWVVRTTLERPDSVRAMVRRAERAGFNTLLVQVRGRGDAYYRSRWEPAPRALSGAPSGYDPLALVLREAHARDLAVHAWVNVHLVNGIGELAADSRHLVRARPGLLAVPRELARDLHRTDPESPAYVRALLRHAREHRQSLEGLYTSPAHPEVKEHLDAVWADLVDRYEVDGLHLDYIRYPSPDFDYSRTSLERFRLWIRPRLPASRGAELDRARRNDPLAWVDALPEAWDDFRRAQITDLVRRTYHTVKSRRPDLTVSAAVAADPDEAYRRRFQDWPGWLEEGILDAAAPMAYTEDDGLFGTWIGEAVRRAGSRPIWAGIGVYRTDFRGTVDQIGIARRRGARGVALFSYDWAVAPPRSDRPGAPFLTRVGQEAFDAAPGAR